MSKTPSTKTKLDEVKLRGDYGKATAWMRKKQIYTAHELIEHLKSLGKTEKAATCTAQVLLSPRKSSTRGDCRGNRSNPWGHLAYNDKLPIRKKDGVKEAQRFRFRFRAEALEARKRNDKMSVEAEKVEAKATVKAKSKTKTKEKEKEKSKAKVKA